jgi:hypothetical protein
VQNFSLNPESWLSPFFAGSAEATPFRAAMPAAKGALWKPDCVPPSGGGSEERPEVRSVVTRI